MSNRYLPRRAREWGPIPDDGGLSTALCRIGIVTVGVGFVAWAIVKFVG